MKIEMPTVTGDNLMMQTNITGSDQSNDSFQSHHTFTESQAKNLITLFADNQRELFSFFLSAFRI
ncbi:MAG: hypothetical protein Q8908_13815, partial [Bacteroidota bacterium]|nr:hypothetical protein [Bacteroidota bacterium]